MFIYTLSRVVKGYIVTHAHTHTLSHTHSIQCNTTLWSVYCLHPNTAPPSHITSHWPISYAHRDYSRLRNEFTHNVSAPLGFCVIPQVMLTMNTRTRQVSYFIGFIIYDRCVPACSSGNMAHTTLANVSSFQRSSAVAKAFFCQPLHELRYKSQTNGNHTHPTACAHQQQQNK